MNYKNYESFQTKHGVIDVFLIEVDDKQVVQMFMTDYVSHSTSSATFTNIQKFQEFIDFLLWFEL